MTAGRRQGESARTGGGTLRSARGRGGPRLVAGMILALVAALAGCGPQGPPPVDRTVTIPGPVGDRTTLVHHPASARPGAPVVIVLHGANGTAADAERYLGWNALADRDGFVVAYADALDKRWNAGSCCRRAGSRPVDDLAFLHELRDRLVAADGVDPRRVFAVGASNGGMLAYAWACGRPGDLAGIGVVGGALAVPCPTPAPLTVVAIHGTADTVLPLAGGPGAFTVTYPSLDEALIPFRTAAACPAQPVVETSGNATVATWRCAGGRSVVRDVITGAGHGWPGATGGRAGTDSGPMDSTGFLWNQLRQVRPA